MFVGSGTVGEINIICSSCVRLWKLIKFLLITFALHASTKHVADWILMTWQSDSNSRGSLMLLTVKHGDYVGDTSEYPCVGHQLPNHSVQCAALKIAGNENVKMCFNPN